MQLHKIRLKLILSYTAVSNSIIYNFEYEIEIWLSRLLLKIQYITSSVNLQFPSTFSTFYNTFAT